MPRVAVRAILTVVLAVNFKIVNAPAPEMLQLHLLGETVALHGVAPAMNRKELNKLVQPVIINPANSLEEDMEM